MEANKLNPREVFSIAFKYFGYFMVGLYILGGTYLLFSSSFNNIPRNTRTIFAVFIILYGLFRLARIYTQRRVKYTDEEE